MKNILLATGIVILFSCSSTKNLSGGSKPSLVDASGSSKPTLVDDNTFLITSVSTDTTYGLSPTNPVEVGGADKSEGPKNERRYLNGLTGPNGEEISYYRRGSCCPVKSTKGFMGMAMLDNYRVTWQGSTDTVSIYINMYDQSALKAPVGFGVKK